MIHCLMGYRPIKALLRRFPKIMRIFRKKPLIKGKPDDIIKGKAMPRARRKESIMEEKSVEKAVDKAEKKCYYNNVI